ncbi:MAG TPA: HEAT repeat domain-containing protein [Thermoanaerobaculia bacterium]|jgi:cyclophilin family peptidyl-prolyl cis-trans isomerase/HEAT repeat protein|nr:HEAT repeat domain-containing protein [Thermoanaerobaculia bacterium]
MRNAVLASLLLAVACTTVVPPPPPLPPTPAPRVSYGFKAEEEVRILQVEDRREYDAALVDWGIHHPNALHRARMALALGRIGPHTFVDANGNGVRDEGERQAGVAQLVTLVSDPDANVRATAAFALGQIGDATSVDALLQFASDADGDVAGEAVEALSKLAAKVPLARYAAFASAQTPEGIRARAIRFLFRFKTDEASAIAADALASPSPRIREEATYALARRAYAPARTRLELLVNDPNPQTRANVMTALGRIGSAESLTLLIEALRDPHPWVRTNAVVAISRLAAKDRNVIERPEMVKDAMRVLELVDDPDPGTRASSIDAIGYYSPHSEPARRRLLEIAANGSRWDRELAAGAIAKNLGDEKLLPADLSGWAKVRVLEAATAISDAVRERYGHDPDPLVRAQALATIADDHVDANLPLIRARLDDADVIVRGYAIGRYSKSHDANKLATLQAAEQRARSDKQNDARLAAIGSIAEVDYPERDNVLRALLTDRDPVVRRIAADSIEQNLKKPRPQYTPLPVTRTDYAEIVEWSRHPHTATIHMTRGNIQVALLTNDAPVTTWNFAQLARAKYFDNSSFMRVVPNFVIQGGDPRNDMEGGPGFSIRDEINLQKYTRAAVGMALSGPDTGGSQFFITHSPQPHLDGGYTIFGRVTASMTAVVDQTERGDKVETIAIDEATTLSSLPSTIRSEKSHRR